MCERLIEGGCDFFFLAQLTQWDIGVVIFDLQSIIMRVIFIRNTQDCPLFSPRWEEGTRIPLMLNYCL